MIPTHALHVGVGLEVTLSPPVLTVFEGEDTIFTCSPLIVPIAAPLLEQDGFVVTREDYPRISFVDNLSGEGNRTYTLRDVERSDNGTWFRCSVAGFPSNITTVIVYSEFNNIGTMQKINACITHKLVGGCRR